MNTDKLTNEETELLIELIMEKVSDNFSNSDDEYWLNWYDDAVDELKDYIKLGEHTEYTFDELANCITNIIDNK
jgi:hypothetical protein